MNILYYLVGSVSTFLGILIYKFFSQNGSLLLNSDIVIDNAIIAGVAGVAFFATDYLMSKAKSGN